MSQSARRIPASLARPEFVITTFLLLQEWGLSWWVTSGNPLSTPVVFMTLGIKAHLLSADYLVYALEEARFDDVVSLRCPYAALIILVPLVAQLSGPSADISWMPMPTRLISTLVVTAYSPS